MLDDLLPMLYIDPIQDTRRIRTYTGTSSCYRKGP